MSSEDLIELWVGDTIRSIYIHLMGLIFRGNDETDERFDEIAKCECVRKDEKISEEFYEDTKKALRDLKHCIRTQN